MSSPFTQIKEIWNKLPVSGRISTIGAAVVTLGILGAIIYYGSQPEYGVLFSDLKPADAQAIVEKLKSANVPYSISNGGTMVQVPTEKIPELRLQMASAGLLSGGHVGFDLFDKTSFGATDFAQQVNYRRAIEGELSKTLESMEEVESARVHLTPKKESVFTEKEEGAKASVMLRIRQGKELSNERTEAVVSLVASAIEGLEASNVSVMDTRGRLLTAAGRNKNGAFNEAGAFNAQLEARQKFESETAARVISLLEPVAGENRVRADVAADVDFSQVEQTEEKYNPQSQVIRSQQSSQESRNSTKNQANLVGARANDPTTQPQPTPAQNQQTNGDQRISTTTNYEIDKTVRRTLGSSGRVNRLTVSVVLDHKNVNGVQTARTPEEIKQFQELVSAAVGADEKRGDSIVVQTMLFDKPPAEESPTASFFEKNKSLVAGFIKYGMLALIAVMLLFFVVRPARKALKAASAPIEEPKLLAAASVENNLENENQRHLNNQQPVKQLEENALPELKPMMTVAELEAQMDNGAITPLVVNREAEQAEKVRQMIAEETLKDPETVASTIRGWLRE